MSTTGDAGRLPSALGSSHVPSRDSVSLNAVIESARRLDELSTARLIEKAAELVHKAQTGGQPLGTLSQAAIVIQPDGNVKLEAAASVAHTAPEKLRGQPGDRRSDVFSLGVLLWEALAHAPLFDGATDDARKKAVLEVEVQPASEMNANVPAELDAICKKALARDPADRYQSAKVMAAEISAVLDDAGYPETNDEIVRYLEAAFPLVPIAPAPSKIKGAAGTTQPGLPPSKPPAVTAPPPLASEVPAAAVSEATPLSPTAFTKTTLGSPDSAAELVARLKPGPSASPAAGAANVPPVPRPPTLPVSLSQTQIFGSTADRKPAPAQDLSKTAVLGSNAVLPTLPPAPVVDDPGRTATFGSSVTAQPLPDPAPQKPGVSHPFAAAPGSAPAASGKPAILPSIATAETIATPALVPTAPPVAAMPSPVAAMPSPPAAAPSIVPTAAPVAPPSSMPVPTAPAVAAASSATPTLLGPIPGLTPLRPGSSVPVFADDDFATSAGSKPYTDSNPETPMTEADRAAAAAKAAAVVSLPRASSESGPRDVLAGWGWKTGSEEAIDDDVAYEDGPRNNRKRLVIAVGAGAGAILLLVIIAIAAGGSKKSNDPDKDKDKVAQRTDDSAPPPAAEPVALASDPPPPPATEPPTAEPAVQPPATEPAKTEPVAEPATAKTEPVPEPAKVEPAKVEPVRVEPVKVEPVKVEPAKVEPPAPTKVEPPKKVEPAPPKKIEPPAPKKIETAPPKKIEPPKKTEPKKVVKATTAKPVDPYATPEKKVDPAVAYKTGFQQLARGDTSGALATLKGSMSANPGYAPTWRGLGMVYEKMGQKAPAKSAFKRYLQLSPGAGDSEQIRERMEKL